MSYGNRKPKGEFTPIYRDEVQYQLNKLLTEYHVNKKLFWTYGKITRVEWDNFRDYYKEETKRLKENEETVERILDYSMEMRTKDQEYLEMLLGLDTEDYIDELDLLLEEIEDEMV